VSAVARPASVLALDLGGVLIDWDPRHVYRELIPDEEERERFLAEVCTFEWHRQHDLGRPMAETAAELAAEHPDQAELIHAWRHRFGEMLTGEIEGTVALLAEVRAGGTPVHALSNMSIEGWAEAQERFAFLRDLDGAVISGLEGVAKPDRAIYDRLIERVDVAPAEVLFIDDRPANVAAARAAGLSAEQFESAEGLRHDLEKYGVLVSGSA
jgi:2-haloacid dehalogenase